jgi:Ca2+-binding EF-hand superfamily protein
MNANDLADRLEQFYVGTHIQKAAEELRRLSANQNKDLTDKEIDDLIMYVAQNPTNEDLYDFARAILRKAQEK